MTATFPLSHQLAARVQIDRVAGGTLLFKQSPGKELSLDSHEWEDVVRLHAEINDEVHKRWRNADNVQGDENATLRWTGIPLKPGETLDDMDTAFLFALTTLAHLPIDSSGAEILSKIQERIDERLNAHRIGDSKRLSVRFYNNETQVHFYEYHPRTCAVINLLNVGYIEWLDFHKHFVEIDGLMQKQAKSRRRGGVTPSPDTSPDTNPSPSPSPPLPSPSPTPSPYSLSDLSVGEDW